MSNAYIHSISRTVYDKLVVPKSKSTARLLHALDSCMLKFLVLSYDEVNLLKKLIEKVNARIENLVAAGMDEPWRKP